ncbi:hypothetical protein B0H14DRAFT_2595573 [Mycena olivaceomarginata]|nr:hypothetical protein B0H14DRAFT_2595573 [Mycena olivaceomarginata]
MALPARFTPRNLTGRFILNPTLSDVAACEDMLREQGIANPALRRAVAGGVLSLNHYEDEIDGVERMWVQQDSGGKDCNVAVDLRVFDWQDRTHEDALFGPVVGRMRRITTDTRPDLRALPPLLRGGWTQETRRCGVLEYQYQFHRGCSSNVATQRTWVETWASNHHPTASGASRDTFRWPGRGWRWEVQVGVWCMIICAWNGASGLHCTSCTK